MHELGVLVPIIVIEDILYTDNRVKRVWDMSV